MIITQDKFSVRRFAYEAADSYAGEDLNGGFLEMEGLQREDRKCKSALYQGTFLA